MAVARQRPDIPRLDIRRKQSLLPGVLGERIQDLRIDRPSEALRREHPTGCEFARGPREMQYDKCAPRVL